MLKPALSGAVGYPKVTLSCGSRQQRYQRTVHKLVLLAFVGECPPGMEVRHLDGNPTNNCLSNLVYGTRSQNSYDTINHGSHNRATLDERRVRIIRGLHKVDPEQFTVTKLASIFGVQPACISKVILRHTWDWVE